MSSDPTTTNFDPLVALYSSKKTESLADSAKVYDNVAVFEANFVRKSKEQPTQESSEPVRKTKSFSLRKKREEEALNRDVSKLKIIMERRKKLDAGEDLEVEEPTKVKSKRKPKTDVFVIMEKLSFGPMSLLHDARSSQFHVNVYTRSFNGLRGVLSGNVVMFDSFLNLSMVNVKEIFAFSPRGKVAEHQKKLNIYQLNQALEEVRKIGLNTELCKPKVGNVTGVIVNFKTTKNETQTVKKYHGKMEKFSGGRSQLYYRHFNNVFVKGNSIVLISKPS